MIGEIVGLLSSVISGIASSGAHDDYSKALEEERKRAKVPESVLQASEIYRNLQGGLPNYEQQKEDIQTQLPTSLAAIRESVSSGSLIDYLAKASASQNQQIRQLNTADAMAQTQNKQNYAQFLGGTQGRYEELTQQTQRELGLAKAQEGMMKTKDNLMFANTGANSLDPTSLVSQLMGNTDLLSIIAGLFGGNKDKKITGGDILPDTGTEGNNSILQLFG